MGLLVGVDAGGTFTDLFVYDEATGETYSHKVPSTPDNPATAIVEGMRGLIRNHDLAADEVRLLAHGTTVGTNTLLQRSGARVSLITTRGFRDLLEIGRQTRPLNFDMQLDYPPPVVPRPRRFEVTERIGASGEIVEPIDPAELSLTLDAVLASAPAAVAVCFLFAFLHPDHESQVAKALAERAPTLLVSLSSEVQPEFREYERFSTTALNAYLQPIMAHYLDSLGRRVGEQARSAEVAISRSNGGLMSLDAARRFPIRTALSGPAAGVVGAIDVLRSGNRADAISFDMGGTSADVALIRGYASGYKHDTLIGGFPVRMPMLDIHTVGAGGGSIAWFDLDDLLKVGPRSAGAVPGPACYGAGGTEPTVSDANIILGRLSPRGLLGGAMPLDIDAAQRAVGKVAGRLGFSLEAAAKGILEIVVANMTRAIRTVSVERGFDPRAFPLLAFGGAGPLHARDVAAALDMREIIVPPAPGILCAAGLLASPFKEDFVRTVRLTIDGDHSVATLAAELATMRSIAQAWLTTEGINADRGSMQASIDMRYVGQNFELSVPLPDDPQNASRPPDADTLRTLFFAEHERQYGYHTPDHPVELINIRLTALGSKHRRVDAQASAQAGGPPVAIAARQIWFDADAPCRADVYDRTDLHPGHTLSGPCIVEQMDSTTLVFPGDHLVVDRARNLIIAVQP